MEEELKRRLQLNGIHFLPWVGSQYSAGFHGRRLLVLGESHYTDWKDKGLGPTLTNSLSAEQTQICVQKAVEREVGAPFWLNLEKALLNEQADNSGWPPSGGDSLWRRLAVYEFVQSPVRTASTRPTAVQFQDSQAQFKALIEELRPERILVCGRPLWGRMPPTPHEIGGDKSLWVCPDIEGYRLNDGDPVWCMAMKHPSRGFSWRRWAPVIRAFLNNPAEAADPFGHAVGPIAG